MVEAGARVEWDTSGEREAQLQSRFKGQMDRKIDSETNKKIDRKIDRKIDPSYNDNALKLARQQIF